MTAVNRGDFYSHVVRALVAPLWAMREGSPYLKHYERFLQTQYRPLDEMRQDQWTRLKSLLDHAYDHTTFYRERFDAMGITPADIRSWKDFEQFPLLTKDDIRANRDRMVADNIPRDRLRHVKTSGSTGVSISLFVDEDSMQLKRGSDLRYDEWTGWRFGERIGAIWGNPEYKKSLRAYLRNMLLRRAIYLDTLRMDEKAMALFHNQILSKKPTLLFGHAHSLYLFACFVKERNLAPIRPKGIISTAMVLHDFERSVIEDVFDCKVTNRYGCEEVSLIACECEAHQGLHVNMDTLFFECLRGGKPVQIGETGTVVLTDLTNRGMPLIRYLVGDTARMAAKPCTCGRTFPLISSLEGRVADYVRTPEDEYISGISLTENFAMVLEGVKQMQIVQDQLDHLLFRVVPGEGGREERLCYDIARLVRERFGPSMRHDVQFVDSIQSETSGKYRFCVSKLEGAGIFGSGRP